MRLSFSPVAATIIRPGPVQVISAEDAATFERCMAVGGFAVFPADTVYGLGCDPDPAILKRYAKGSSTRTERRAK